MTRRPVLLAILLIGLGLRLFRLDSRPLGFTWDEAAIGYNAYSLLLTGRDEYGKLLPLVFKSFGDYKPGLYIYLAVPAVRLFDLTESATRLPSAILGTVAVALVYVLARQLLGTKPAVWAASLLAISPWAVHFSRAAWESNVSLTVTLLAVTLFLRRRYLLSALFFGLTLWAYQGAKMFTPLLIISLLWFSRTPLRLSALIRPAVILLAVIAPIIAGVAFQSGRLKVFSVFSYQRPPEAVAEILRQDSTPVKDLSFYLFHSETLDQLRGIAQRYLNHLSPRFLFIDGDWSNPRQSTPFYGQLHLPEFLTLLVGLYVLLRSNTPGSKILLSWLLLAPLPSALSRDIISAVRSLPMVVPLTIISGLGLSYLTRRRLVVLAFMTLMGFFLVYFFDLYFIHSPHYTASGWLYPYKPALTLVADSLDKYSRVVISDKLGQPYIFTLFYLKVNPGMFQGRAQFVASPVGDVGAVTGFGKFEFRPIFWPADRGRTSTLFVGDIYELPESDLENTPGLVRVGEIAPPDGYPGWRVVALP